MRVALLDNRSANLSGEAAAYLGELAPEVAADHKVTILTVRTGIRNLPTEVGRIRHMIASDRPDVVHVNNLSGLALAAALWAIDQQRIAGRPPIALGLHDDRLLRHWVGVNRRLLGAIGLVVSPSAALMDRHLARDFFPRAIQVVIPYAMPYHVDRLIDAYRRLLIDRRLGDLGHAA